MDEYYGSAEFKALVEAVQGLIDIEEDLLTDEVLKQILENVDIQFTPQVISQSVNQIVQNLENQGATKTDAIAAVDTLNEVIKEFIYGDKVFSPNKKQIVDAVFAKIENIFNTAKEKYHAYNIDLPIKLEEGAKIPTYAHDTDAAADLYALEDTNLNAHTYGNKIRTGVSIQLPEGWMAMILPRSSIGANTTFRLSNSVGIIDSGYRGELGVLYDNTSDNNSFIRAGDRIAQLLVMPSYRFRANVVDSLEDSDRGTGGFGSTGT